MGCGEAKKGPNELKAKEAKRESGTTTESTVKRSEEQPTTKSANYEDPSLKAIQSALNYLPKIARLEFEIKDKKTKGEDTKELKAQLEVLNKKMKECPIKEENDVAIEENKKENAASA